MGVGRSARVLAQNALWRATGSRSAGQALVRELGSDDESARALAGMLLVQAGGRAAPLLRAAVARGESLPNVLPALADVGGPEDETLIGRFAGDPDPLIDRAARDALRVLRLRASDPRMR